MLSENEEREKIRVRGKPIFGKKLDIGKKSLEMRPCENPGKILDFNQFLITF
jgi:hypothetical protein